MRSWPSVSPRWQAEHQVDPEARAGPGPEEAARLLDGLPGGPQGFHGLRSGLRFGGIPDPRLRGARRPLQGRRSRSCRRGHGRRGGRRAGGRDSRADPQPQPLRRRSFPGSGRDHAIGPVDPLGPQGPHARRSVAEHRLRQQPRLRHGRGPEGARLASNVSRRLRRWNTSRVLVRHRQPALGTGQGPGSRVLLIDRPGDRRGRQRQRPEETHRCDAHGQPGVARRVPRPRGTTLRECSTTPAAPAAIRSPARAT